MVVKLLGVRRVSYVSKNTGAQVNGWELHVMDTEQVNSDWFTGYRTAQIFTTRQLPDLKINGMYDLIYHQNLGSDRSYLQEVREVK